MNNKSQQDIPGLALVGYVIFGGFVTGIAGLFGALLALLNEWDYVGMGLCLLAAAVAFGLTANALLRA